jgi:hypothetical protein
LNFDRAKRRPSVDHRTGYYFSLAEDALKRPPGVIDIFLTKLRLKVSRPNVFSSFERRNN